MPLQYLASSECRWDVLRLVLEGYSPIDLDRLYVSTPQEASEFLKRYGFCLDEPKEAFELEKIRLDALRFMQTYFCQPPIPDDLTLTIPDFLLHTQDLRQLLIWASQPTLNLERLWSCGLLRIMHTMIHAQHAFRNSHFHLIRDQILGNFKAHIYEDIEGQLSLGPLPEGVPLLDVRFKEGKSPDSIIIKLLHKPENVSITVYDRLGVKFVTEDPHDALLVLRYLREKHLVSLPNLTPGRSRNNLIDLEVANRILAKSEGDLQGLDFLKENNSYTDLMRARSRENKPSSDNLHSSPDFKSIQFTCRQLVRVPHPSQDVLMDMQECYHDDLKALELMKFIKRNYPRENRRFFPFEVQIMDLENHRKSLKGHSSHAQYKRRQIRTARRRVLGGVILHELKKRFHSLSPSS